MRKERILQIIKGSLSTEKSYRISSASNQLIFKVCNDADKFEIKNSIENLLDTKVLSVNIAVVKGKSKRTKFGMGFRSNYKKAYVTIDRSVDIQKLISQE